MDKHSGGISKGADTSPQRKQTNKQTAPFGSGSSQDQELHDNKAKMHLKDHHGFKLMALIFKYFKYLKVTQISAK